MFALSQAGSRLLQAVLKLGSMAAVMRVACWLELHMDKVVRSRPAVFVTLVVVDRLVSKAEKDEGFYEVIDMLVTALLVPDQASGQPLLVVAALDPVGHLLAREVVSKTNLLPQARDALLCVLQEHIEVLSCDQRGAGVLKALQGII